MIHGYQLNGYNIVLDIPSGSIHQVDPVAYDVIMKYQEQPEEDITIDILKEYEDDPSVNREELQELFQDIQELITHGKLFSPDEEWDGLSNHLWKQGDSSEVKALCLHVAHTCNMTCDYCFASQGRYHGNRALMTAEVGKKAIDFLIESSGKRHNLEIDFFGGEPLMNWGVVKEVVAYARGKEKEYNKHFRFTLTTNGLLIDDEIIDFANREMDNVVLSLDGRKEVHDRLRRTTQGEGSYEKIVPLFQRFVLERGEKEYYIRGTFTRENIDFTKDLYHMADLGFDKLSIEPVVCSPEEPYAFKEEDLPLLMEQYEELALEMVRRGKEGRGFTFYHYMMELTGGPCIYKRLTGCGSGREYLAVTPWGDLYPCHQFVGEEKFRMGDLWNGITATEVASQFEGTSLISQEECRSCWARLYCSGGCAANSYHATGDIHGVYEYGCKLFKKRLECAIMIKVAQDEV